MKKKIIFSLIFAILLIPGVSLAARTDNLWSDIGGYIKTNLTGGYNILINGINKYINFNTISGSAGYGLRDNGGTIEIKNSGGAWNDVVTASTSVGSAYQVLNTNESGIAEWTYDLGSATQRLGTIYSDYLRTKWLEVSQNVIDNSFKIGSSTNALSTNLLFANTSGDASIIYDTDGVFKISTTTQITGNLTANNIWYKDGNTLGSKKTLGSIDNQDFGIITNNTERITVLKGGNVGIGTTAPTYNLDVVGTISGKYSVIDGNYYALTNTFATFNHKNLTGAGQYALRQSISGDTYLNAALGRGVWFNINNTSKMVIAGNGDVGIGTATPSTKLQVVGEITKGLENSIVSGVVFTQTADRTIGNTTTETSMFATGVGSLTIPANSLVVGRTYRIKLKGYASGTNGDTSTIKVKLGTTEFVSSTGTWQTLTDIGFTLEFDFTCRTTGTTGTVAGNGYSLVSGGQGFSTVSMRALLSGSDTLNTTVDQAIDLTYQWSDASAGNTITITNASVEVLN